MNEPRRPFGLSLAIIASVMLFAIFPLLDLARLLLFRWNLRDFQMADSQLGQPLAMGANFTGLTDSVLFVHAGFSVLFLVIAVLAWRGRPRWIRFALLWAVVALLVFTAGTALAPLLRPSTFAQGVDSGFALLRGLVLGRLLLAVLISLYVVWYVNRAPARAFYRGYYLPRPETAEAGS